MTDQRHSDIWTPSLVIGLGGSGLWTLRFINWLAKNGGERSLEACVDNGDIQFLAIDTDRKDNHAELEVDPNIPMPIGSLGGAARANSIVLPVIGNMLELSTQDIANTLKSLRCETPRDLVGKCDVAKAADPNDLENQFIRAWFPPPPDHGTDAITIHEALEGGAGQWRPLGRIGLFRNIHLIYPRLMEAMRQVARKNGKTDKVHVHLVCSLSGGTGAGMFWDIAFLVNMMADEMGMACDLQANFLLPAAFAGLDSANRVKPNAYAALQELAVLKNWRGNKTFKVRYNNQLEFRATPGTMRSVFRRVFLYETFPPTGKPANEAESTFQTTTFRVAENLLARMRSDVYDSVQKGADNELADFKVPQNKPESSFVYSTSSTVSLVETFAEDLTKDLLRRWFDSLSDALTPAEQPPLGTHVFETTYGSSDDLLKAVAAPIVKRLSKFTESKVSRYLEDLEKIEREWSAYFPKLYPNNNNGSGISEISPPENPFLIGEKAKELIDGSEHLRELTGNWHDHFLDHDRRLSGDIKLVARLGSTRDIYRDCLDLAVKEMTETLEQQRADLERTLRRLPGKSASALKALIPLLEDLKRPWANIDQFINELSSMPAQGLPALRAEDFRGVRNVAAPAAFIQMRFDFGVTVRGNAMSVSERQAQAEYDKFATSMKVERIFKAFIDDTREELQKAFPLAGSLPVQASHAEKRKAEALCLVATLEHLSDPATLECIIAAVAALLAQNEKNEKLFSARRRQIREFLEEDDLDSPELQTRLEQNLTSFQSILRNELRSSGGIFGQKKIENERNVHAGEMAVILQRAIGASSNGQKAGLLLEGGIFPNILEKWEAEPAGRKSLAKEFYCAFLRRFADVYFEQTGQSSTQPEYPVTEALCAVLDEVRKEVVCLPWSYLADKDAFDTLLLAFQNLVQAFITFWFERQAFIDYRFGGEDNLRSQLLSCKSNVFAPGRATRTIHKENLVVTLPRSSDILGRRDAGKIAKEVEYRFANVASGVLGAIPKFPRSMNKFPIIYFEEMFRSGKEIRNIEIYRNAYLQIEEDDRRYYHFHYFGHALPDLVATCEASRLVLCGNDGCLGNIREISRSEIICPHCRKPIRNRCGNSDCKEDNLVERIKGLPQGTPGDHGIPYDCPACNQEMLTYWWRCGDQTHNNYLLNTNQTSCPRCVDEVNQGRRPLDKAGTYLHDLDMHCPGCDHDHTLRGHSMVVPGKLMPYFTKGVAPNETTAFLTLTEALRVAPHECANRSKRHYVFPTCPEGSENPRTRHHVFWDFRLNKWRCSVHPGKSFCTCHHCGYPVEYSEPLHGEVAPLVDCPRCGRSLQWCPYCSKRDGTLFQPLSDAAERQGTCPRCTNNMLKHKSSVLTLTDKQKQELGFCPNMFGCRAGADHIHTAANHKLEECLACNEPHKAPLLPLDTLQHTLDSCPVCLMLTGTDGRAMTPAAMVHHCADPNRSKNIGAVSRCPLCGTTPPAVLGWLVHHHQDFLDPGPLDSEAVKAAFNADISALKTCFPEASTPNYELSPAILREILVTLKSEQDSKRVKSRLHNALVGPNGSITAAKMKGNIEKLLHIVAPQSLAGKVLAYRMNAVIDELRKSETPLHRVWGDV